MIRIPAFIAAKALAKSRNTDGEHVASYSADITRKGSRKVKETAAKVVYQMGGGDPPPMPPQESAQQKAEARDWELSQQEARDAVVRAREDAQKAEMTAKELAQWRSKRANTYKGVQNYGQNKLKSYGLDSNDPYGIYSSIQSGLDSANSGLSDMDDLSGINNSLVDTTLSDIRGQQRNKFKKQLNTGFDDYHIEDTFADTADDTILQTLMGGQYNDAYGEIDTAFGRGQLTEGSREAARKSLEGGKSKALADLQGIGGGVLSKRRDDLRSQKGRTASKINEFDFGDTLDIDGEIGRLKNKSAGYLGSLEGDIRTALGDKRLFDPASIVGKANATSSMYTPLPQTGGILGGGGANPALAAAFDDAAKKKLTEGVF